MHKTLSKKTDCLALSEAVISRRTLPCNLVDADLPLFLHELEKQIPPCYMLRFTNVTALPSGRLFKSWRLLPESFAGGKTPGHRAVLKIAWERLSNLNISTRFTNATWIVDSLSAEYFHWFTDALPRLFMSQRNNQNTQLVLPAHYAGRPYIPHSLEAFDLHPPIFLPATGSSLFETLEMPTPTALMGNYNDELIRSVGKLLRRKFGNPKGGSRRIYVSRAKAGFRHIANEVDILPIFNKHEFEIVHLETMPFPDQVRLMSETAILVSNHGAGLTNMMFMLEGGKVLEIRKLGDNHNNCYFSLASAFSHDYYYLQAPPKVADESVYTADLVADAGKLENILASTTRG